MLIGCNGPGSSSHEGSSPVLRFGLGAVAQCGVVMRAVAHVKILIGCSGPVSSSHEGSSPC